jgi:hypothetical protein
LYEHNPAPADFVLTAAGTKNGSEQISFCGVSIVKNNKNNIIINAAANNNNNKENGQQQNNINPCAHTMFEGRYVDSPFARHRSWNRELITLDELDGRPTLKLVNSKGGKYSWLSESLIHAVAWVKSQEVPLPEISILDAGCGVLRRFLACQ